jgi:hypothetical protein
MWWLSGCLESWREVTDGREELYLYGDPAYKCTEGILSPFTHPRGRCNLPLAQQRFNRALASVRIAVENAFGQTEQLWTYTAFEKGLKSGLQAVGAHFAAAILLIIKSPIIVNKVSNTLTHPRTIAAEPTCPLTVP